MSELSYSHSYQQWQAHAFSRTVCNMMHDFVLAVASSAVWVQHYNYYLALSIIWGPWSLYVLVMFCPSLQCFRNSVFSFVSCGLVVDTSHRESRSSYRLYLSSWLWSQLSSVWCWASLLGLYHVRHVTMLHILTNHIFQLCYLLLH